MATYPSLYASGLQVECEDDVDLYKERDAQTGGGHDGDIVSGSPAGTVSQLSIPRGQHYDEGNDMDTQASQISSLPGAGIWKKNQNRRSCLTEICVVLVVLSITAAGVAVGLYAASKSGSPNVATSSPDNGTGSKASTGGMPVGNNDTSHPTIPTTGDRDGDIYIPPAPSNLAELCDRSSTLLTGGGYEDCMSACLLAKCCMVPPNENGSCALAQEEACGPYGPCQSLTSSGDEDGSVEIGFKASDAKGTATDTSSTSLTKENKVKEVKESCSMITLKSDPDGIASCSTLCDERWCCFAVGVDNCYDTAAAWCDEYSSCQNLFLLRDSPSETGAAGAAGAAAITTDDSQAVEAACQEDRLEDPEDREFCRGLCDQRWCCFIRGVDGCYDSEPDWCDEFEACNNLFVLSSSGGLSSVISPGFIAAVKESGNRSTIPTNGSQYEESLSDSTSTTNDDFLAVERQCSLRGLDDLDRRSSCQQLCDKRACCFVRGEGSCHDRMTGWCDEFALCWNLYRSDVSSNSATATVDESDTGSSPQTTTIQGLSGANEEIDSSSGKVFVVGGDEVYTTDDANAVNEACQPDKLKGDTEDLHFCESLCAERSCCFFQDAENCYLDNTDWCHEFEACRHVYGYPPGPGAAGGTVGSDGEEAPSAAQGSGEDGEVTAIQDACQEDQLRNSKEKLDRCKELCEEEWCCFFRDEDNCYEERKGRCDMVELCKNVYGYPPGPPLSGMDDSVVVGNVINSSAIIGEDGGTLYDEPINENIASAVEDACQSEGGDLETCRELCNKEWCCFFHERNCYLDKTEWCDTLVPCELVYGYPPGPPSSGAEGAEEDNDIVSDVKDKCQSEGGDIEACKELCNKEWCCFFQEEGNCYAEKREWCDIFLPCEIVYGYPPGHPTSGADAASGTITNADDNGNGHITSGEKGATGHDDVGSNDIASNVEDKCQSEGGDIEACKELCNKEWCCFFQEEGNCYMDKMEWCDMFLPCEIVFGYPPGPLPSGADGAAGDSGMGRETSYDDTQNENIASDVEDKCHWEGGDMEACKELCNKEWCCFFQEEANCYAEKMEWCNIFIPCEIVYGYPPGPPPSGADGAAVENTNANDRDYDNTLSGGEGETKFREFDNDDVASDVEDKCQSEGGDIEACKELCNKEWCCFFQEEGNCYVDKTEWCDMFLPCEIVYGYPPGPPISGADGAAGESTNANDHDNDNPVSGGEGEMNYGDFGNDDIASDVEDKCQSEGGDIEACKELCNKEWCCFFKEKGNCYTDKSEWCDMFLPCEIVYGYPPGPTPSAVDGAAGGNGSSLRGEEGETTYNVFDNENIASDVEDNCQSEGGDLEACKELCNKEWCCFFQEEGNCYLEKTEWCDIFLPCEVVYGYQPGPPASVASSNVNVGADGEENSNAQIHGIVMKTYDSEEAGPNQNADPNGEGAVDAGNVDTTDEVEAVREACEKDRIEEDKEDAEFCMELCEKRWCCFVQGIDNCHAEKTDWCDEFEACQNLFGKNEIVDTTTVTPVDDGGDLTSAIPYDGGAGGRTVDTTDEVTAVREICQKERIEEDEEDAEFCMDLCDKRWCCFVEGIDNCYNEKQDWCDEFGPCENLFGHHLIDNTTTVNYGGDPTAVPPYNGGSGAVAGEGAVETTDDVTAVREACEKNRIEKDEEDAEFCMELCDERWCCFVEGIDNCYNEKKDWCDEFEACQNLLGKFQEEALTTVKPVGNGDTALLLPDNGSEGADGDVDDTTDNVTAVNEACQEDRLDDQGGRELCSSLCEERWCCFVDGVDNCSGAATQSWCDEFSLCNNLYDVGGGVIADESGVHGKVVKTYEEYEQVETYGTSGEGKEEEGKKEDNKEASTTDDVLAVEEACQPERLGNAEDDEFCKSLCDKRWCCFAAGADSCRDSMSDWCGEFSACLNVYR